MSHIVTPVSGYAAEKAKLVDPHFMDVDVTTELLGKLAKYGFTFGERTSNDGKPYPTVDMSTVANPREWVKANKDFVLELIDFELATNVGSKASHNVLYTLLYRVKAHEKWLLKAEGTPAKQTKKAQSSGKTEDELKREALNAERESCERALECKWLTEEEKAPHLKRLKEVMNELSGIKP